MRLTLKSLISFVLITVITLTTASMAVARGQMRDASGAMVICTGNGSMTVLVDSQGQPIDPSPICPDCAFSFLDFVANDHPPLVPLITVVALSFENENTLWQGSLSLIAKARGPPLA